MHWAAEEHLDGKWSRIGLSTDGKRLLGPGKVPFSSQEILVTLVVIVVMPLMHQEQPEGNNYIPGGDACKTSIIPSYPGGAAGGVLRKMGADDAAPPVREMLLVAAGRTGSADSFYSTSPL